MAQSSQLQPPPSNLLVDLRSDTVTQPSAGMRQAMLDAPVGDDVFGEDESIQALQQRCAELTGHEAALFCPSGTMTNQIAIQVHTRPGDEVICDKLSHIYNYEGGGIARNSGASVRLMHGDRGRYDVEEMIANIKKNDMIITSGGLIGKVVKVDEKEMRINLGDTEVRIVRSMVVDLFNKDTTPANTNDKKG